MSELERLRLSAIPEGRRLLREQHGNLRRVAEYCQDNYLQAGDKRKALEETMALSAQSLASVAYQVGSVAGAFLRLLELQAAQLSRVEADVTCVAQRVAIHEEKVARREIGALAVPRRVPSGPRVAAPPEPPGPEPPGPEPPGLEPPGLEPPGPEPPGLEPPGLEPPGPEPPGPQRYCRKPLDLSALDGVGHGVKDTSTQLSRTGTLARRSTKGSSAQPGGTLGRSTRVPEPVQPPVVPQGKLPLAPLSSSSAAAAPGDGIPVPPSPPGPPLLAPSPPGPPPPAAAIPPPPPLPAHLAAPPAPLPPPAPHDLELLPPAPAVPEFGDPTLPLPPAVPEFGDLTLPSPGVPEFEDLTLPPPPPVPEFEDPTLPPPPAVLEFGDPTPPPLAVPEFGDLTLPPPPAEPEFGDLTLPPPPAADDPPWAPQNYLEKVVALYPYERQKDTELSLAPGALLFVTRRFPDGWCEGVMDSGTGPRSGIFPGNFVEPV